MSSSDLPGADGAGAMMAESDGHGAARYGESAPEAHARLRDAILRGDIEAGARMSQMALAEQFQVGRTPLREALRMLQREGLVVSELNRRVAIAPLSSSEAEDLYIMRIALEVVALRLTVPTLTSIELGELEGLMAQMSHFYRTGDHAAVWVPHRAFHQRLVRGAGARGLATIGELFDHAERYRVTLVGFTPDSWPDRHLEHREILDAVVDGDLDRAAAALAGHYARTARSVFARLEPERDLSRLQATLAAVAPGSERSLVA